MFFVIEKLSLKSFCFELIISTIDPIAGCEVNPLIESIAKSTISTPWLIASKTLADDVPDVS